MAGNVSAEELAKAFQVEEQEEVNEPQDEKPKKVKHQKQNSPKFTVSIVVFVVGLVALVVGLVFLIINLNKGSSTPDATFLVEGGEWVLDENTNCIPEDADTETNCASGSGVIWKFTEVGKGTLTTNNHINDYDFIWAIDGDTLKIETDWLYTLNDEYKYNLNQREGILTLKTEDESFRFLMVDKKTE